MTKRQTASQVGTIRLGIIGCGYWGQRVISTLQGLAGASLEAICELHGSTLEAARELAPAARAYDDYARMLSDGGLDAVIVATPAVTHYAISLKGMLAGLHVLVEKPAALSVADVVTMGREAGRLGLTLMVGHTYLYNASILALKEALEAGRLGSVKLIRSSRAHRGLVRPDVDSLWDLAPHDVSMANFLYGALPQSVSAWGTVFSRDGKLDSANITLHYPGDRHADIYVSWIDPNRKRTVEVFGVDGTAIFDDIKPERKLKITEYREPGPSRRRRTTASGDGEPAARRRQVKSWPEVEPGTPLERECDHFIQCVRWRRRPISDILNGLDVVRVLEAASTSIVAGGQVVQVKPRPASAIELAQVQDPSEEAGPGAAGILPRSIYAGR